MSFQEGAKGGRGKEDAFARPSGFARSDASSTARPHAESIDGASVLAGSSHSSVVRVGLDAASSVIPPADGCEVRASALGAAAGTVRPGAAPAAFAFWIDIRCPSCEAVIVADTYTALEVASIVIVELVDHEYDCPARKRP